jgi:hypothetical protein
MDKEIVNTARKDFILDKLVPAVETFERNRNRPACFGMPYIRTLNAKPSQTKLASLLSVTLVTSLLFFSF